VHAKRAASRDVAPLSAASFIRKGFLHAIAALPLLHLPGAPLFLFVGFSVGMMGWTGALALFCFCELIAYTTITSFSALVTNGRMRGGGAYFMSSRSLGPAFGGSSGLLFWITYCLNVTFNTRSFTDVVFQTFFEPSWPGSASFANELAFSSATLFLLFLVAFNGACGDASKAGRAGLPWLVNRRGGDGCASTVRMDT
jgi:hypothetical protein